MAVFAAGAGEAAAAGDAIEGEPACFGLNHECFAGEGEAIAAVAVPEVDGVAIFAFFKCFAGEGEATPDTAVPEVAGVASSVFFACLCLAAPGEAPGLGLDVADWPNTDDTEKAANRRRRTCFFISKRLPDTAVGYNMEIGCVSIASHL